MKRIFITLLLVCSFLLSAADTEAYTKKDCTFIGDSRGVGCRFSRFGGTITQVGGELGMMKAVIRGRYTPETRGTAYYIKGKNVKRSADGRIGIDKETKIIVSWMGVNEIENFDGWRACYDTLLDRGYRLILLSVGEVADDRFTNFKNERVLEFNRRLRRYCKRKKDAYYIDLSACRAIQDKGYLKDDGLHYTRAGYRLLRRYISRRVKRTLPAIN